MSLLWTLKVCGVKQSFILPQPPLATPAAIGYHLLSIQSSPGPEEIRATAPTERWALGIQTFLVKCSGVDRHFFWWPPEFGF